MKTEPPFLTYRFLREWQYMWCGNLWYMQSFFLSNMPEIIFQKGKIFDKFKKFVGTIFKPFSEKPKEEQITIDENKPISIDNLDLSGYDKDVFDLLNKDWNSIYENERHKGSVLGAIAEHLTGRGEPIEDLKEYNLNQLNNVLTDKYQYSGLEEPEKLMKELGLYGSQFYSYLFTQDEGAKWLAIYNDQGQRAGRSYEVITKMYRKILAESIKTGQTVGEIKSKFVFPGIEEMRKEFLDGDITEEKEKEFQELIDKHLNRDMLRFAKTDTAISINNGRIIQGLVEGRRYFIFSR
jgi:hypothetical protein